MIISPSSTLATAPRRRGGAPTESPKKDFSNLGLATAAVLLVLLIGGAMYWFLVLKPKSAPRPPVHTYTFMREALEDPSAVSKEGLTREQIFSEENMLRYYAGEGLNLRFVVTFRGQEERAETLPLPNWTKADTGISGLRRQDQVVEFRDQTFSKYWEQFGQYTPRTWVVEVYLDDTEGVTAELGRKVRERVEEFQAYERIKRGDGFEIYFYRLSSTDHLNRRRVLVPQKSDPGSAVKDIEKQLDWLLEPRSEQKQSSIATGLFNAAKENGGKSNRHLIILSDYLENYGGTTSFYKEPPALDRSNWDKVDDVLDTLLYSFPNPQHADKIRASLKYFEDRLKTRCRAAAVKSVY
jgi:hypothetical protein